MGHPLIGGGYDHVWVGLEELDAQQPIMVRRLLGRWDAEPLVVRIEIGHVSNAPEVCETVET